MAGNGTGLVLITFYIILQLRGTSSSLFLDNSLLKQSLGVSIHNSTWKHLLSRLEKQFDRMWDKESFEDEVIPEIHAHRLRNANGVFPESIAHKIRRRGIVIVRELVSKAEVSREQSNLVEYIYSNLSLEDNDFEKCDKVTWSKAQTRLRQNENVVGVMNSLLGLFHVRNESGVEVNLEAPVTLVNGLRIRVPKKPNSNFPPEEPKGRMNGNCMGRWRNPAYRRVYEHILNNRFEDYDPFELNDRLDVGKEDPGYLRLFEGWLALSTVSKGSLRVVPLLKEATAYIILRALMRDVPSDLFPGCSPRDSSSPLVLSTFYHSILHFNMIPVPELNPGDAVWWHEDLIHSERNDVEETESVMILSTGPDCKVNQKYARKQRHGFILRKNGESLDESHYEGASTFEDLTPLGRDLMGWTLPKRDPPLLQTNKCSCRL